MSNVPTAVPFGWNPPSAVTGGKQSCLSTQTKGRLKRLLWGTQHLSGQPWEVMGTALQRTGLHCWMIAVATL